MSLSKSASAYPPVSALLLLCLLLFAGYRACHPGAAARIDLPAAPQPQPGTGIVGTIGLSQAPRHVQRVVHHLRQVRHWQPLRGYKGGRSFQNYEGTLPRQRVYYEYDVHPLRPNVGRGAERLVVDESKTLFYYTRDHYTTFTQILLP